MEEPARGTPGPGSTWRSEKSTSSCRRKGYGYLELGIITATGTFKGIGPGVVENVFTLGVAFQVHRQDAHHPFGCVLQAQVVWGPASAADGRFAFFQRSKKSIGKKRVERQVTFDAGTRGIGTPVPGLLTDFFNTGVGF